MADDERFLFSVSCENKIIMKQSPCRWFILFLSFSFSCLWFELKRRNHIMNMKSHFRLPQLNLYWWWKYNEKKQKNGNIYNCQQTNDVGWPQIERILNKAKQRQKSDFSLQCIKTKSILKMKSNHNAFLRKENKILFNEKIHSIDSLMQPICHCIGVVWFIILKPSNAKNIISQVPIYSIIVESIYWTICVLFEQCLRIIFFFFHQNVVCEKKLRKRNAQALLYNRDTFHVTRDHKITKIIFFSYLQPNVAVRREKRKKNGNDKFFF